MVLQKRIKRSWSFSGLATMVRIVLMYYFDYYSFFEQPEKDWQKQCEKLKERPPDPSLFDWGGLLFKKSTHNTDSSALRATFLHPLNF